MDNVKKRFWSKVEKTNGCWLWKSGKTKDGYGRVSYLGRNYLAHRFAWMLVKGEMPPALLLHKCDNPPCVNPEHLFEGNMKDNVQDCIAKGRFPFLGKGSSHPRAKLSDQQVEEIRERYEKEDVTHRQLAKQYGVNHSSVGKAIRKETYYG